MGEGVARGDRQNPPQQPSEYLSLVLSFIIMSLLPSPPEPRECLKQDTGSALGGECASRSTTPADSTS